MNWKQIELNTTNPLYARVWRDMQYKIAMSNDIINIKKVIVKSESIKHIVCAELTEKKHENHDICILINKKYEFKQNANNIRIKVNGEKVNLLVFEKTRFAIQYIQTLISLVEKNISKKKNPQTVKKINSEIVTINEINNNLYQQYQEAYNNTPPGNVFPQSLTGEQISWVHKFINQNFTR